MVTLLTDPSYRAMVLLDTTGEVVVRQVGDLPSGLGLGEVVRLVREQEVAETSTLVGQEEGGSEVFRGGRSEASSQAGAGAGVKEAAAVKVGSGGEEQVEEGSSGGEAAECPCNLGFSHTRNLHRFSTLEKKDTK